VNEFMITRYNPYNTYQRIEHTTVQGTDINAAMVNSGWQPSEIIAIRLVTSPPYVT